MMTKDHARWLCTGKLAQLISESIQCEQPNREGLDWVVAQRFLLGNERFIEPIAYTAWPDTFDATAFEATYGKYVHDEVYPAFVAELTTCCESIVNSQLSIHMAIRHFCIIKLARLFHEHFCSDLTGDARTKHDWNMASRHIDAYPNIVQCIGESGKMFVYALYNFPAFELRFGEYIWNCSYVPLVTSLTFGLGTLEGYTSMYKCEKHPFGCIPHADHDTAD